ncbi:hypothetical protein COLO4_26191 [Corchorus olitorius]|uniref:AB hydrolase-1 domain-containing protein n=1 Tax=Corchorus olitorius TaxID=93759 RepID=A0A1R3HY85_9ROSI|nr:hypothetical protein COLO4_26191 [Corchorus olitorius]
MAEEISKAELQSSESTVAKTRSLWPSVLRWIPTSTDRIIAAEKRLLSLVKTPYVQEQVNIGSGAPGSKVRWFRSSSNEPRFINTVTFDSKEGSPTLVMVHGYAASQGFFFKNFDYLAKYFKVIAIDQLGGLGPWGPNLVSKYTTARFSPRYSAEGVLTEEESKLLTDYVYHTLAAKASGELCLKYIFAFGAFARMPLLNSASEWKVPTTFIYGVQDWMNYQGAQEARKQMKAPCEIIRVPQSGHFVFLENPSGFHSAMLHACRRFLSPHPDDEPFPEGLVSA